MTARLYDSQGREVRVYDVDGRIVFGAPDAPPVVLPPITPPTGPDRNVAAWCSGINLGKGVTDRDGVTVATAHRLAVDVIRPTFEWVQTKGFVGQDGGATFRATASVNGGTPVPVLVAGAETFHLDAPTSETALTVTSDPVQIEARAGDTLTVSVWADADTASGSIPSSFTGAIPGQDPGPLMDRWALRPSRVVAPSDQPAWVAVGDSICQQNQSFPQRALGALGVPFTVGAQGGDRYTYHSQALQDRQAAHLAHASRVLDEMGINDAGHEGSAPATDRENARKVWAQYRAKGVDTIVKTTLTLAASTTDGWATLDGQNYVFPWAPRDEFNRWLRAGAPLSADKATALAPDTTDPAAVRCDVIRPDGTIQKGAGGHHLTAVSDVAVVVEEGTSGKYNAAGRDAMKGWSDGLHPSPAVHAMLAERLARDLQLLGY